MIETVRQLQELQYSRLSAIRAVNRQTNAAKAMARRALGWHSDSDETTRKRLNERAAKIVLLALKEAPQVEADQLIADAIGHFLKAVRVGTATYEVFRHDVELQMRKLARSLPVWDVWAKQVKGLGDLGLAVIVAEAGLVSCDPNGAPEGGNYPNPGKLWKRLGLAPFTKDGRTKACASWRKEGGLTSVEWADPESGPKYSPKRRAEMYAVIGESLLKQGPYRQVYLDRLAAEHAKAVSEGLIPASSTASTVENWTKRGLPLLAKVSRIDLKLHRSAGYMAMRAHRYMVKVLLRDLWSEWRRASRQVETTDDLPAASLSNAGEPATRRAASSVKSNGRLHAASHSELNGQSTSDSQNESAVEPDADEATSSVKPMSRLPRRQSHKTASNGDGRRGQKSSDSQMAVAPAADT